MSARFTAWEIAFVLTQDHPHRLTPEQHILCLTTVMRVPERAALEVVALGVTLLGSRT